MIYVGIFGIIFWSITSFGDIFFYQQGSRLKNDFYECGFKSFSDINININPNFYMFAVLLVLYDVEFTLLLPFTLNSYSIHLEGFFIYIFFIWLIILSFYIDWRFDILNWHN